jgi:hypothetical protein
MLISPRTTESMDLIFGNTTVPTWALVIVVLLNISTVLPRLLLSTARSQSVGTKLQMLESSIHDLELYVFENREHLPVFLRMRVIESELEK